MSYSDYLLLFSYVFPFIVICGIALVLLRKKIPLLAQPDSLELSASQKKRAWRVEILIVLICALVFFALIYFNFLIGRFNYAYADSGMDTRQQYIPFYLEVLDSLRQGSIAFWDFDLGLGVPTLSSQVWLLDPFNIILLPVCLLFGDTALPAVLIINQGIRILVVAVLCDWLLHFYCQRPLARIVTSLGFSFSGFLMLWGTHYWFGNAYLSLMAIMVSMECMLRKPSGKNVLALAFSVALTLIWSVYAGFMVMVFCVIYCLLRAAYLSLESSGEKGFWARYLKRLGFPALSTLAGCFIACIAIVPVACILLGDSNRIVDSSSADSAGIATSALAALQSVATPGQLLTNLSRAIGNNLIYTAVDTPLAFELPQLSCSVGIFVIFFLFLQWIFGKQGLRAEAAAGAGASAAGMPTSATSTNAPTSAAATGAPQSHLAAKTVILCISVFLAIFYLVDGFLSQLLNAFAGASSRSSFDLIIVAFLMIGLVIDKVIIPRKMSRTAIVLGALAALAIILYSAKSASDRAIVICACMVLLLIVFAVALLVYQGSANSDEGKGALASEQPATKTVGKTPRFGFLTLALVVLLASILVDAFASANFRYPTTDEDFPVSALGGYHQDTEAALAAIATLEEANGTDIYRVEKDYTDWTGFMDALVQHYTGVSAYNSTPSQATETFVKELYPTMTDEPNLYAYLGCSNDSNQPEVLSLLGVRYLLSKTDLNYDWCTLLDTVEGIRIYQNNLDTKFGRLCSNVISEEDASALSLEQRLALLKTTAIVPNTTVEAIGETSDNDGAAADAFAAADSFGVGSMNLRLVDEGHLTGTIAAANDCVAVVPISYNSGWRLTIDDVEQELFCADYGFLGFCVQAGNHDVSLSYEPVGWKTGAILTAIGVLLLVLSLCLVRRGNKDANKE